jgi:hypothetical protein
MISTTRIQATTRKINAKWTLEAAADLSVFHNVDIEQLILNQLKYELENNIYTTFPELI